ncbi:MAG: right-handed parallel beta-helix repeat-containing protein [Crocinitomicaceae bacterium]|nr:right-handed parallel beta-helix repeat-containing protein [Crocinitomicaceae bacterium]
MKKISQISYLAFLILLAFNFSSCKKEKGFSKGNLTFSVDTVLFDTVFTTLGSTTEQFKIYNNEKKIVNIEEVELMGGVNSPFRINIDGISAYLHKNIEMPAKDSLFAFVEVTLDVNGQTLPMIIEDSVRFRTNGKDQYVKLAVWGQDAYFHNLDFNEGIWPNDKPHVIYNRAYVDSAKTLIIQPNTKIHLHKNSMLFVYKGTLKVEGTKENEVIFQGDRLEAFYKNVAGQYYGIYFQESEPSTIDYAIIKNGTAGVHATGKNTSNSTNVTITNTQILNHASYGIFLFDRSKVKVENSIIAKSGAHGIFVLQGGTYDINHCHLVGYGKDNQSAVIGIKNYYNGFASGVNGNITNSVIYGTQRSEIAFDTVNPNNDPTFLNIAFKRCLIKLEEPSTNSMYQDGIIWNENPLFTNISEGKYKPLSSSPLNNAASGAYFLPLDIEGNPRDMSTPDIGAYEF